MIINLGENIRRLRGERSLTQEQLAYELGVSPQAISRWETGGALPDISMLPVMADFFDVTLDELMGRGTECPPEELERLVNQTSELKSLEKPDEAIALARKAAGKYPRDEYVLMLLANQLYRSSLAQDSYEHDEIIELCKKVRRLGKHPDIWVMATQRLVKLYIRAGQCSKAQSLAGKLPSLFCSREIAVCDALPDSENKLECSLNNIKIFRLLLTKELNTAARLSSPNQRTELEKTANLISEVVDALF